VSRPDAEGHLPRRPRKDESADGGALPSATAGPAATPAAPPAPRAPEPQHEPQRDSEPPATQSLQERLAAITAAGGLTALPADFGDVHGDWLTVRAADPFTVLVLDHRQADRISPEMVSRHRELLQRFWQEKLRSMTQGAARFAILKKYGGPEESERLVRSYPELIENAYQQLITRGAIDEAHRRIVEEKESIVCRRLDEKLDDFLVDLVLQPEEVRSLFLFGESEGLRSGTVADRIQARLRVKGLVPEGEPGGATLEARLLSTAWVHPSKRRSEVVAAIAAPPRKASLLVPLLLFSMVVVLVLLAAAALRSAGHREQSIAEASSSTHEIVSTETAPSTQTTTVTAQSVLTPETQVPEPVEPPPAATETVEREPSAPAVDVAEQQRIREELAAIEREPEPQSGLDRLSLLEPTLSAHYVDERIAAAKLRSDLERALLLRQVEEEKRVAGERAAADREREWMQRIAAIEELMKQPNYSGAKTLADQLLASPDVPPSIAERGRELRDQAVLELQKIFSRATVKSRTGRAPRRQP
jgi:hypothetical protein